MPSFILIRPTVWPQCTNVTDRTDRQRTDSTGRIILQTAAQKSTHQEAMLLTLLLTLCGLTSQKTNQGGLGLCGSVHEEAHPCCPNFD